jgi:two-component system sensor histidine kinase RegB
MPPTGLHRIAPSLGNIAEPAPIASDRSDGVPRPAGSPGGRSANIAPAVEEPRIILQWIARLRWLAVAGQALATLVAVRLLKLQLPVWPIVSIIVFTAVTNMALQIWVRQVRKRQGGPAWLVPGVLILDVILLTALLVCSGGPNNPFSLLYLVHVAMAVVTLGDRWSLRVLAVTATCYAALFIWHWPLTRPVPLTPAVAASAERIGLVLVAGLIAYFVGRITRSLRQREKELAVASNVAARNEQLAALATLAAGAAHQLNTPLGTIAVVARELEVLSRQMQLQDSFMEDARLIRQEVDRCQVILSRMRVDVLHGEPQRWLTVPIDQFLAELRGELKSSGAAANLKVQCDTGLQEISGPLRAVQQAIAILIDNAVDASKDETPVKMSIFSREGRIIFEVEDQGVGMAEDVRRRAGEPFFTTKAPGDGMGLGLFLVRLVAEKLGGSFRLESRTGLGTRAVLELPESE